MGNALRFLCGNCGKPAVEEEQAGTESLRHHGVTTDTIGVSALAHDLFHFEITSQVPEGLNQHVGPSTKAQAKWYLVIGDVRGRCLMIGVELVHDRQLKNPAKNETLHVMDQMKEIGVLIGKRGFYGNVFRITPPLCFTKQDADFLADVMDNTLSKI